MESELYLFKTRDDFERVFTDVNSLFNSFPPLVTNYIRTIEYLEDLQPKWKKMMDANEELSERLDQSQKKVEDFEKILANARKKLEDEMIKTKRAQEEARQCKEQLGKARQVLNDESVELNETAWARLSFLKSCGDYEHDRLDTIDEAETTGSVITDLSYTRDEEDLLDESIPEPRRNKRPHKEKENQDPVKRRKSTFKSLEMKTGERIVATTTVTVEPNGPCTATSVIKNIPSPLGNKNTNPRTKLGHYSSDSNFDLAGCSDSDNDVLLKKPSSTVSLPTQCSPFTMNSINTRPHNFVQKAVLKGDDCNSCHKKIRFSAIASKCKDCRALVHVNCRDNAPLPCVPIGATPSKHNKEGGRIADYTPPTSLMVPALVIHCIKEIENRGLNEVGLYRIPGSDKEVKSLKETLLRGRGVPNLSEVPDIHVVCGTLKDFLRSLKEPIVTTVRWSEFVRAAEIRDLNDRRSRLVDIISELPKPNRDTLAYIMLHLQRVADRPECMMGVDNLSVVFGPTIVGLSKKDPSDPYGDARSANKVTAELLKIPGEYYESFIQEMVPEPTLPKTPSSYSLKYFVSSPRTVKPLKETRYFETP